MRCAEQEIFAFGPYAKKLQTEVALYTVVGLGDDGEVAGGALAQKLLHPMAYGCQKQVKAEIVPEKVEMEHLGDGGGDVAAVVKCLELDMAVALQNELAADASLSLSWQ